MERKRSEPLRSSWEVIQERLEREPSPAESDATDEQGPPAAPAEDPPPPDPVAELRAELDRCRKEREAVSEQLLRKAADLDNLRKRTARDREAFETRALGALIQELLPAIDDLDRALAADGNDGLRDGVRVVRDDLARRLRGLGLDPIETAGADFDPAEHEAVAQLPREGVPAGRIVEEVQRGYRLKGTVLRASRVVVAAPSPPPAKEEA